MPSPPTHRKMIQLLLDYDVLSESSDEKDKETVAQLAQEITILGSKLVYESRGNHVH